MGISMRTSNQESFRTIGCLLALLAAAVVTVAVVALVVRLLPAGTGTSPTPTADRQQIVGYGLSGNPIYRLPRPAPE